MENYSRGWLLSIVMLILALGIQTQARVRNENGIKSSVFVSPMFVLEPGSVVNKIYYNIDFPRGHIALKNFSAEVVDEAGNPVPLHETYLHHWVVVRYYQRKGVEVPIYYGDLGFHQSDFIVAGNAGICDRVLTQIFGLGSETRKTATHVPDPYGIEVGNPAEIPAGYEERWLMNVHAIDTRGAEDRLGCTECRCDLYNVTEDEDGRPLRPDYIGGLKCCYDQTQCKVRVGFERAKRGLYMRYTVKWVDWDNSILPVRIYILDVTDTWKRLDESTGLSTKHDCLVEYEVESCAATGVANDGCIDRKRVSLSLPTGGNVIYGVAHQHTGGIGSTLYGEDGRVICSSIPTYGDGKEAGNEAGYIVGMSTCYPQPGSVMISDGETLVLESNYSSAQRHTGVMGLFYILVADPLPRAFPVEMHEEITIISAVWGVALFGVAIAVALVVAYRRRSKRRDGYQSMVM
uniref:Stress up-regulated Nod 19 n=1 Tax=Davidia involucrata TaxID=16924 RepID=A0A5B7A7W4_DAVIN